LVTANEWRVANKCHPRNIAASAGASGRLVDLVAQRLIAEKKIRMDRAKEVLEELTRKQEG
jgi:hydroxymethylglutaryl-CoA reductase